MEYFERNGIRMNPKEMRSYGLVPSEYGVEETSEEPEPQPFAYAIGGNISEDGVWRATPPIPPEVWDHEEVDGPKWTPQREISLTASIEAARREMQEYQARKQIVSPPPADF